MSDAFAGMKDATRGYASNFVLPGRYLVQIVGCDFFETRKGESWKNTLTVLAVEEGDHKPGETVHTFWRLKPGTEGKTVFQSNVKAFVAGVMDVPDEAVDEEAINMILNPAKGESNPLEGHVTLLTVSQRDHKTATDSDGKPVKYAVYSWSAAYSNAEIRDALNDDALARFFPSGLEDPEQEPAAAE